MHGGCPIRRTFVLRIAGISILSGGPVRFLVEVLPGIPEKFLP